eukprot:6052850-Prymnesium_polylepis.1
MRALFVVRALRCVRVTVARSRVGPARRARTGAAVHPRWASPCHVVRVLIIGQRWAGVWHNFYI